MNLEFEVGQIRWCFLHDVGEFAVVLRSSDKYRSCWQVENIVTGDIHDEVFWIFLGEAQRDGSNCPRRGTVGIGCVWLRI